MKKVVDNFGITWYIITETNDWCILTLNGKEYAKKVEFMRTWKNYR